MGRFGSSLLSSGVTAGFSLLFVQNSQRMKASKLCNVVYALASQREAYVPEGANQNQKLREDSAGRPEAV